MNELVSIIVPIYNSAKWLPKCLDSLLRQSYPHLEIILVNDGSSDTSNEICSEYTKQYPFIKYLSQKNQGVSVARNEGIRAASGEFILFVDSDDWVSANYVADLLNTAIKSGADFAVSGMTCEYETPYSIVPEQDFIISIHDKDFEKEILKYEKSTILYAPYTGIYRAEIIKRFDIKFPKGVKYGEDRIFNWRYLSECKTISFISKSNYHYRQENSASLSHDTRNQTLANSERLYRENKLFHEKMRFTSRVAKSYTSTRLLNAISNELLCFPSSEYSKILSHVASIRKKSYIPDILAYADKSVCPCWLYMCLYFKLDVIMALLLKIKTLLNKRQTMVLTLPLTNNYGGCLQAFALVRTLNKLSYNALLYEYMPKKKVWSLYDLKNIIKKFWLNFRSCSQTSSLCPDFAYTPLKRLSGKLLPTCTKFAPQSKWVVGSDQVWRCLYSRGIKSPAFFFLDFLSSQQRNQIISYAASFGTSEWEGNPEETHICKHLLKKFKKVSVREQSGVDICANIFGVSAEQMPDPTLLLSDEDYEKVIMSENCWKPNSKYIASYILDPSHSTDEKLKKITERLGLQSQSLISHVDSTKRRERFPFTIPQWLCLIRDCEYLLTDSFHGCVFAIIYNKPFVCLGNEERGTERFNSLMKIFSLESRFLCNASSEEIIKTITSPINWERVNEIRESEKKRGINFLKNSLKE